MNCRSFAVPALLVLSVLGACRSSSSGSDARASESERFARFLDEAFESTLARDPMRQGFLGDHRQNDRWTDPSDARQRQEQAHRHRLLERLRKEFDADALDADGQLSYRLFEYELERDIAGFRWRKHSYLINQMYGPHTQLPTFLMNVHRVEDIDDAEAYVKRLDGMAAYFDVVVHQLLERQAMGVLPPRFAFPLVLDACRKIISGAPFDESGDDSALLADFRGKVDALQLSADVRAGLIAAAEAALRESVEPAYRKLITTLERQAKVATTDDGAWKLPNGDAFYADALSRFTTTDLSADEIHDLGLAEVARIHDEMRAIMRQVEFEGDLDAFFEFLRTDPRFYYPEGEEGQTAYLDRATEILGAMSARLPEVFGTLPQAPLEVRAVEPYREQSSGKAFYNPGTPDGSRPGIYYANLYRMSDMPIYQMEALAFHEGVPGHHLQNSIARELRDVPRFRRFGGYTAYGEGWGLYSEAFPKELGFYEDPYSDFGRLAMELWRACRLVVDTGLHDKRWTREQAIAYLRDNTPNPEGDCVKAIERYIVMPGQATAYKIGMWKILELRREAKELMGDAFLLRDFHDVVLTSGPVPLAILEERVRAWASGTE